MRVSIIVPAYNSEATLGRCLEACTRQTYSDFEVIVVDDGSSDRTGHIAQSFDVRYIRQANRGPAAARNRGAREASGQLLAYTDADCIPARDWLEQLVGGLKAGVAGVGGTYGIANRDSLLARMVQEEIAERHARFGEWVDFLGSFNVLYRRSAFEAAGGFDEAFRTASGEDNDLAYRLADKGGRLRFVSTAVVAHHHPEHLLPYMKTQATHGYWRMKLYAKHMRRARGDRYAGPADLLAPPLSLLLACGWPLLVLACVWPGTFRWLALAYGVLACVYGMMRVSMPVRMARRTGESAMLLFAGITAARDLARAIGMVRGAWRFLIREKIWR